MLVCVYVFVTHSWHLQTLFMSRRRCRRRRRRRLPRRCRRFLLLQMRITMTEFHQSGRVKCVYFYVLSIYTYTHTHACLAAAICMRVFIIIMPEQHKIFNNAKTF